MDRSNHLSLPYIAAAQAQKHVTHNEALRALDDLVQLSVEDRTHQAPPAEPLEGTRLLVPADATGDWLEHRDAVASFVDGAWMYHPPRAGWRAWCEAETAILVFDGTAWQAVGQGDGGGTASTLPLLGINATADNVNRLVVKAEATLHDNEGAGHQLKINKAATADTASLLFQTGYAGKAEIGLAGSDDLSLKVEGGGAWPTAFTVSADSGRTDFQFATGMPLLELAPRNAPPADPVDGAIWYDSTLGRFQKREDGATTDLDTAAAGSGGGGTPGGPTRSLQFNDGGTFGGADVHWNSLHGRLGVGVTNPLRQLHLSGAMRLESTTGADQGVVYLGTQRFMHAYGSYNLFLGNGSGNFTMTGGGNVGMGESTLRSLTTGGANMAIGRACQSKMTSGSQNIGVGFYSMLNMETGQFNLALGTRAMLSSVSAIGCVGVGYQALENAEGTRNVAIGHNSGRAVSTGARNTILGADSGTGLTTGSDNVLIGSVRNVPSDMSQTVVVASGSGVEKLRVTAGGDLVVQGPVVARSYTVAGLPDAAQTGAGAMAFVTDEAGGAVPAFSDGTVWRRSTDRAVVQTA